LEFDDRPSTCGHRKQQTNLLREKLARGRDDTLASPRENAE